MEKKEREQLKQRLLKMVVNEPRLESMPPMTMAEVMVNSMSKPNLEPLLDFISQELDKAREEGRLESANEQLAEIELSRNEERKRTLEEIIGLLDVRRTHGLSEMFVVDQIVRMLDGLSKLKQ